MGPEMEGLTLGQGMCNGKDGAEAYLTHELQKSSVIIFFLCNMR